MPFFKNCLFQVQRSGKQTLFTRSRCPAIAGTLSAKARERQVQYRPFVKFYRKKNALIKSGYGFQKEAPNLCFGRPTKKRTDPRQFLKKWIKTKPWPFFQIIRTDSAMLRF